MRVPCAGDLGGREEASGGEGAIAERVPGELSGRGELRGIFVRAALAAGVCLPGLRRRTRGGAEEPGAHPRMPRLRSPDVDHGRDGDAPVQVAADGMVLGRASHGNALEWHVGSPVRSPARHHVQNRSVAGAEAPTIDDRSRARAAGGRGRGRPSRNPLPRRQQLFRSREIRKDPYRWRCRGDRPRHKPGQAKAQTSEIPEYSVWAHPSRRYRGPLRRLDRGLCAGQREDRNDAAHRRAQIVSRAHRLPARPSGGRQDGWPYRAALGSSGLGPDERWGLGPYHGLRRKHIDTYLNEFVFRYNRRFYRHVSFETMLGLASHHHPTSYWDIVGRDNPRKGAPTVRRAPRRRRTATGMRADGSRPPEKTQTQPLALDIDQPGTTG